LTIESEPQLLGPIPVGAFLEDFDEFRIGDAVGVAVVEELVEVCGGGALGFCA